MVRQDQQQVTPRVCPSCRSTEVTAAGRKVNASTYWRCEACGHVWNPERSAAVARYR